MVATVAKEAYKFPTQVAQPLEEFHLQPGEEYEVTVVASNGVGNSSESNPVFLTPPTFPATTPTTVTKSNFDLIFQLIPVTFFVIVWVVVLFVACYRHRSKCFLVVNIYVVAKPLQALLSTYSLNSNQSIHYCLNLFHLFCRLFLAKWTFMHLNESSLLALEGNQLVNLHIPSGHTKIIHFCT